MAAFRPSTLIRSGIIVLALVCLGSWYTFHAYSQSNDPADNRLKSESEVAGNAPSVATGIFLAAVEQFGVGSGAVDLFTVTLGGSGAADTFTVYSPATVPVSTSTPENKPDIDNPLNMVFDNSGDLLVGNGGTTTGNPQDNGSLACIPSSAITTTTNSATTVSTNVDDPVGIAYDSRDGSVGLANNPTSSPVQLAEFLLSGGTYTAATGGRNLTASGYGSFGLTNLPTLPPGSYAISLTTGLENDPAHNTGSAKIAIMTATSPTTSTETDILPSGAGTNCTSNPCAVPATYGIDIPHQIAWDTADSQLVIANNSAFHKLLTFYNLAGTQLFAINTGLRNDKVAVSPDGHVAVSGAGGLLGYPQVEVYDNTASRNAVGGPIPFNGTTTSCGSTYIYGSGAVVNSLTWLSNTKLLIALQSYNGSVATAQNGLYIYDISASAVPAGFDDKTCSAFAAAPKQTGFVHINNKPLGTAFKPLGTFAAGTGASCNGNPQCYTSINTAIQNATPGAVVNVLGGTFNESVNLNSNVIINLNANTTVNDFTISTGTLNGGGGFCSQAGGANLTLATGNFTSTGGTFNAGSGTVTLAAGNWVNNGGTYNPGTGTVVFTGSGAQSIGGSAVTTFNNLTVNKSGNSTLTLNNNNNLTGNLSVTSGTFDLQGFIANRTAAGGTLSVSNGAVLKIGGANTLPANYSTYSLGSTSTIEYEGAGTQTIAAVNYGNLTSSNSGARILSSSGTIGIFGVFTPGTNAYTVTNSTIDFNGTGAQTVPAFNYNNLSISNNRGGSSVILASGTIGIAGAFNPSATNLSYQTSGNAVNFNGTATQTIPAFAFNDLSINNAAGANLGGSVTVGGNLTLTSGVLAVGSQTLVLNAGLSVGGGSLSSNANGTVNYNQASNGQSVLPFNYGNLTFSNFNKTLPSSGTIGIAGTFTPGSAISHTITGSTVNFNGTVAQTIPAFAFNNLTLANTSGISLGANINVNGTLLINSNVLFNLSSFDVPTVGTLSNNGDIRKTQTVSGTGAKTFGLAGSFNGANLTVGVATQGTLSSLQVDRFDSNHPNAAAPEQTGRYWVITPTGTGYSVNLTLPRSNPGAPSACRYTGTIWDCDVSSSTANTVTRNNVTALSPWAVGNNAITPPTISKAFSASSIQTGGQSTVTLTLSNSNINNLVSGAFTDTLTNMSAVGGTVGGTCSGTTPNTLTAGATALSFSGIIIPANGSCTVTFPVTSSSAGALTNTTSGVTTLQTPTAGAASNTANLTVYTPPSISKAFAPTAIAAGGQSTVTLTLTNSNTTGALTNAAFTDTLANMSAVAGAVGGTCTGTTPTSLTGGATALSFSGITIPTNGSCMVTFSVTSNVAGINPNTTSGVTTTQTSTAGTASNTATLSVTGAPTITKSFTPASIALNGISTLTITITNPAANTVALTGVGVSDPFPTGMEVDATPAATNSCSTGTFAPVAAATSVSISGATIPVNTACIFTVNVKGTSLGAKLNTTDNVTSANGGTGGTAAATLTVESLEGDVAPRPNGSASVTIADVQQLLRFQSGADKDYQSDEFQRADCAPRDPNGVSSGNGRVTIADVQQALRYQTGADPLQLANGPTVPTPTSAPTSEPTPTPATPLLTGSGQTKTGGEAPLVPPASPTLKALGGTGYGGQNVTVQIQVDNSDGTITGFGFTLKYDRTLLTYVSAAAGADLPAGSFVQVTPSTDPNNANLGQLGVGILTPSGTTFPMGSGKQLLTLTFKITSGAMAQTTPVTFSNNPATDPATLEVTNAQAQSSVPITQDGTVSITQAPTAANVTVGGRVLTATGRGVRNVVITMTDSQGTTRTATTTAFGYYRFEDVEAGQTYVFTARGKRFTFNQNTIVKLITEETDDVNFVAYEQFGLLNNLFE